MNDEVKMIEWQALQKAFMCFFFVVPSIFFAQVRDQDSTFHELVKVLYVVHGNETNNALFRVKSTTNPAILFIRAKALYANDAGFFTLHGDNIRYTSVSTNDNFLDNKSLLLFSFLDTKKQLVSASNFRVIINDIDGPFNEALATKCTNEIIKMGIANPTNIIVENTSNELKATGSLDEKDGPTSRVLFDFQNINEITFENYGNNGFFKDFDFDDDYPIEQPIYIKCKPKTLYETTKTILSKTSDVTLIDDGIHIQTRLIYFDLDNYEIRPDALEELSTIASILHKNPSVNITIKTHTDSRAPDDYNLILSEKRANACVQWLVKNGVSTTRIRGIGVGENELVNDCKNGVPCSEKEHQQNRRAEFFLMYQ